MKCDHRYSPFKRIFRDGSIHYPEHCTICGAYSGKTFKHDDLSQSEKDSAPDFATLKDDRQRTLW